VDAGQGLEIPGVPGEVIPGRTVEMAREDKGKRTVHGTRGTTPQDSRRSRRTPDRAGRSDLGFPGMRLSRDVEGFCTREDITQELGLAVEIAKRHFDIIGNPNIYVDEDPEYDDKYIVLEITTRGDYKKVSDSHCSYARDLVKEVKWPEITKIRLAYDII
jgi:hypothetical protein